MNGDKPSLRDWIKEQAENLSIEEERLLFSSPSRDPMWMGTASDHRNAEWFARYWRRAIEGRSEDRVHVRGVHYVMIEVIDEPIESPSGRTSWTQYRNTTTCYNFLKDASVAARVLGYVPLDGIKDEESDVTTVHEYAEHDLGHHHDLVENVHGLSWPEIPEIGETAGLHRDDIEEMASHLGRRYANELRQFVEIDNASQQPFHIEIWSEKTPPASLHDLARRYGVNLIVTGTGDLSYQVAYNLARRINRAKKPGVILYLSDFDPKGDNMAQAMAGKVAWLNLIDKLDQRVVIQQLAVTPDQIDRYGLPRTPIDYEADPGSTGEKAYQTLVDDWERRKGHGATELQALWRDEQRFVDEIEPVLSSLYDGDLDEAIRRTKTEWQREAAEDLSGAFLDADLDDEFEAAEEWAEEFNDVLEDAERHIERLNDLIDDDRRRDWTRGAMQALRDTDLDDLEPPEGEAELPDDPLYDSARGYGANIAEVRAHEQGQR